MPQHLRKKNLMKQKGKLVWLLFIHISITNITLQVFAQEKPTVKLGGALRFQYNYSNWKEDNKNKGGDFAYDVFRLNANVVYKKLQLNAEYRFYPTSSGGGMLKSGWVGYHFNESHQFQVGLTEVPFGILPYTSNNFFFNINYYLGLEDDSDMGLKYVYKKGKWNISLAFFKNSDLLDYSENKEISDSRYAYDIAGRNKEANQFNARITYNWGTIWKQQLGVSGMTGGLYNLDTKRMGEHKAFASHYTIDYKHWNFKAQYTYYKISPQNKDGDNNTIVSVTAYGAPYNIASEADTYSASLSYTLPIHKGILDEIQFYNDFSMIDKREADFNDSFQNITGCMLSMGPIYTYIDYALGRNHAWLGNEWSDAFAQGVTSKKWHTRFNVNIGYYF